MMKLAGKAVIQSVTPTHEHVKPEPVKKAVKSEPVAPVIEVSAPVNEMPAPPVFTNLVPEPVVDVATGCACFVVATAKQCSGVPALARLDPPHCFTHFVRLWLVHGLQVVGFESRFGLAYQSRCNYQS
jgi:hypothetical protein